MRKIVLALLIIICSVVIVASFFMVWARAVTTAAKVASGIEEKVEKAFPGSPFAGKMIADLNKATEAINEFGDVQFRTVVRGYEIPVMVNRKFSKTALSLIQIFDPGAGNIGNKALLLYLIPFLALVTIVLTYLGLKSDIFVIIVCAISGVISVGGLYRVMTADISNNIVRITLDRGLWQTLYGYLMIFVFSIIWLITDKFSASGGGDGNKR